MSMFPSVEAMLLEVYQGLGCQPYQTKQKDKFAKGEGRLENHIEMGQDILLAIFNVLDLDPASCIDVTYNLENLANAHTAIELEAWTFGADQRQVLWMLLGYFYVPGLARFSANWNLEEAFDRGMPGGIFWFLPDVREVDGVARVTLPVAQVIDWLLDLLGMSLEEFADSRSSKTDEIHEGIRRTLYNWRKDSTPDLRSIRKYFSDDQTLDFDGAFTADADASTEVRFSSALEFVRHKGLSADTLRKQIPMTEPGLLEAVLSGAVNEDVKEAFIRLLSERYEAPSMRLVRQRLHVARLIQDGYSRLLRFLFPGVDRLCGDYRKNKLLQVVAMYKAIYNHTLAASKACDGQGEEAEHHWFEERLPPWHVNGLLLSIAPSRREYAHSDVAKFLTRHFSECVSEGELEDHFEWDELSFREIAERNLHLLKMMAEADLAECTLAECLQSSFSVDALKSEHRLSVLLSLTHSQPLRADAELALTQRLWEVVKTPLDKLMVTSFELERLLNTGLKGQQENCREKAAELIALAEGNPDYELMKAPILRSKARHFLACNDFGQAEKFFLQALEACNERGYGRLRGALAMDCWAIKLSHQKLVVNNHEKYYRTMLMGGAIDLKWYLKPPSIEVIAREVENYFWGDLYKPYPGEPVRQPS